MRARVAEKRDLFDQLYRWLRSFRPRTSCARSCAISAARYHVDIAAFCDELCMDWDELATLAADPLVTIGAHTVNHVMLAKVPERTARSEMEMSRSVIEAALGMRPEHLAYPVGDRTSAGPREFRIAAELGFKTAVTTRPGVLFPEHREHLTALPRISLNGEYQQLRYVRVLLSGAATAMWNGFRRSTRRSSSLGLIGGDRAATSSGSAASPAAPSRARRPRSRSPSTSSFALDHRELRERHREQRPAHHQHDQQERRR